MIKPAGAGSARTEREADIARKGKVKPGLRSLNVISNCLKTRWGDSGGNVEFDEGKLLKGSILEKETPGSV